jgi:RNA polymerase sigma factor (sigma-70 family)
MAPDRDPLLEVASESFAQRFIAGDPSAVEHARTLVRGVLRFRGYYVPVDQRTDLTQDVMLHLVRALSESEGRFQGNFDAFVRAIAHRRCVDWLRQLREGEELSPSLPDQKDSPHDAMATEEKQRLCDAVVRQLRGPCREIIGLRFGIGLSYRQIGEQVGRSEVALRSQMVDCLGKARELLGRLTRVPRPAQAPETTSR